MKTRALAVVALGVVLVSGRASGQAHEPDPDAMKAFAELVQAHRARPALTVKTTIEIRIEQGGVAADPRTVEAEFVFGGGGVGVIRLRGFTCYVGGGRIVATHESSDESYYSIADDGSPYYALMSEFLDMPFPHLALAFGEPDITDVCMQFHQMAPWIQPTAVDTVMEGDRMLGRILMTSDFDALTILYDPNTRLIESIDLGITGGDLVQAGATLTYRHTFEYETHDAPLPGATFAFEPGERQRVDMMGALVAAPDPGPAGRPGGGAGGLVGTPAPPFVLATADGGAFDLEEHRGQVVVLDFWATWCAPCRRALPMLQDVARWASNQEVPVKIVTVNVWERDAPDERLEKVRKFWKQQGLTMPVVMDYTDQTAQAYGLTGIPATVVIRSDGVVHAQHMGVPGDYVKTLKREIIDAIEVLEAE